MQQKKIVNFKVITCITLLCSALANAEGEASVDSEPTVAPTVDVYQNGLMATVYTEDAVSGTRASSSPVGIPIGEFPDNKMPSFSFINLKQEPEAWNLYSGAHIGILWKGYFHAKEKGNYVFMVDAVTKDDRAYRANSCVFDLKLSETSVVKNSFKWKNADSYLFNEDYHKTTFKQIPLKSGYYPLAIWLHCGVSKGHWDQWVGDAENMTWTLKVKQPSDRIVQKAQTGMLVWK